MNEIYGQSGKSGVEYVKLAVEKAKKRLEVGGMNLQSESSKARKGIKT